MYIDIVKFKLFLIKKIISKASQEGLVRLADKLVGNGRKGTETVHSTASSERKLTDTVHRTDSCGQKLTFLAS